MRKSHFVEYPSGEITLFYAVAEEQHDEFWAIATLIFKYPSSPPWPLVCAALSMLPTHQALPWRMDEIKTCSALIQEIFFEGSDGSQSAIAKLHHFEPPSNPKPSKPWEPGTPFTEENLEFPSGGDARSDSIASLLASTELRAADVRELRSWLSREELTRALYTTQELLKGPKQRIQEMIEATAIAVQEGRAVDATGEAVDLQALIDVDSRRLHQ